MSHEAVLKLLFPVPLGGVHAADLAREGAALDALQARAEALAAELFPDTAVATLADWERVYGLPAVPGALDADRQSRATAARRDRGGSSRAYFIARAEDLGYQVEIDEPELFEAGISGAGNEVMDRWAVYGWRVRWAGPTGAAPLEELLAARKPAHTYVVTEYDPELADA